MYQVSETSGIIRVADGAYVPADPRNTDYQAYLAWVEAGNAPAPYVPAVVVPDSVDMAQARLALLQAGRLAEVEALVAAMPGTQGQAARIEWEFRPRVRRDSALVLNLAAWLGLSGADLDALFVAAATL